MTTSKLEGNLKSECLRWVKPLSEVWFIVVVGSGVQGSGVPDVLLCVNGHFVACEFKRPDGKGVTSEIQKAKINRIRKAGGRAEVIDSFDGFKELIGEYL